MLPRWLHQQGVQVVIAGGMGRRALDLFAQNGIAVHAGAPGGTPETLAQSYVNGALGGRTPSCGHDHSQCSDAHTGALKQMKLAITAQGPEPDSPVDLRFGRARYFRIVDTETGQQTAVDNAEGVNAVQGAGIQRRPDAGAPGRPGRRSPATSAPRHGAPFRRPRSRCMPQSGGTAEQAAQAFMARQLRELAQADVRGHW